MGDCWKIFVTNSCFEGTIWVWKIPWKWKIIVYSNSPLWELWNGILKLTKWLKSEWEIESQGEPKMWGKIAHPTLAREDTYMWYISDCVIVAYQHVWHRGSLSRTRRGVQIMDLEPSVARLVSCVHECRSDWTVRVQSTFCYFPKSDVFDKESINCFEFWFLTWSLRKQN